MSDQKKHMYTCFQCKKEIVTVVRDEKGVLPVFMSCRVDGCKGLMHRDMGNPLGVIGSTPIAEWRRPTEQEKQQLTPDEINRVNQKGLLLFPIKQVVR